MNRSSFQEAHACTDNLNRQLQSYIKAFDKLENFLVDMSVTVELGITWPTPLARMTPSAGAIWTA